MPSITCIKCGHVNPASSGAADEACPRCGVIYAKAQPSGIKPVPPVVQARRAAADRASSFGHSSSFGGGSRGKHVSERDLLRAAWVDDMRRESLYPTFRAFAQFGYIAGLVIAGVMLIVAAVTAFSQGVVMALLPLCGAVLLALLARASKEFSLMAADVGDALVRMAARQEMLEHEK